MFAEYFGRENGCYLKSKDITATATAAELSEFKHYDNRSVDCMSDDPNGAADPKPYSKGMKKRRNVCYQRDKPIDDSEDNKRNSCPYKVKPNPGQN